MSETEAAKGGQLDDSKEVQSWEYVLWNPIEMFQKICKFSKNGSLKLLVLLFRRIPVLLYDDNSKKCLGNGIWPELKPNLSTSGTLNSSFYLCFLITQWDNKTKSLSYH